jgi:hypothetical protein
MQVRAYPETYLPDIWQNQARMFEIMCTDYPQWDARKMIADFLLSGYHKRIDEGHFMWASLPPPRWVKVFLITGEEKPDTSNWSMSGGLKPLDPGVGWWMGAVYAYYQWYCNVKSRDLVSVLTVRDMERMFNPLHTVGEITACRKIWERYKALGYGEEIVGVGEPFAKLTETRRNYTTPEVIF